MEDRLGFLFLPRPDKKVKLTLFGVDQKDPAALLTPAFLKLNGVRLTKYDRRRNIAEVQVDRRSEVTRDEILQTIMSTGLAAEVLSGQ